MLSWKLKLAWGENCSKNRKIRAKVDSRIYGRWRLHVMGSWSLSGADPGFFLGGGAPLRNDVTDR